MTDNSSETRLTALAELLFMPLVFYVMIQWEKISTWQGRLLLGMIFILVQNEFLTVRKSYRVYNIQLYLLDMLSLIMYIVGLNALTKGKANPSIGYDPSFWIYLSILWFGYALWDFLMSSYADNCEAKVKLKSWGRLMIIFFFITLACGGALFITVDQPSSPFIQGLIYAEQIIPFSFILFALVWWLIDLRAALGKIN